MILSITLNLFTVMFLWRRLPLVFLLLFLAQGAIAAQGDISTIAGGAVGDGNPAISAYLHNPSGVSISGSGDVFIADTMHHRVRKVNKSSGIITTVAGNGEIGYSGDGGPASSARLNNPSGVYVDATGNIFIADTNNHCVRKVDGTTGTISTIGGTGTAGYGGDGGVANQALLNTPFGVFVDVPGNVFIADSYNARIRKIDLSGVISTVAGSGVFGFLGDGGSATAITARLANPQGVVVDAAGEIFIADSQNNRIRKVSTSGIISTVAGNGTAGFSGDGGDAVTASLNYPRGLSVDTAGNMYIADYSNHRIRRVASGVITTFAGDGSVGNYRDGGAASAGSIYLPMGMALDNAGNLYIAETGSQHIRKIDPSNGIITNVAGSGTISGSMGDGGTAAAAALFYPEDVSLDASGNMYIADASNNRIRKVNKSSGTISTVAGEGGNGYSGDGGSAVSARLGHPEAVSVHVSGDIYVADTYNNRIRKIDASTGIITTVAGNGIAGYSGDGGPAESASLNMPMDISVDTSRNLLIVDRYNHAIRRVDGNTGVITTIVGNGIAGFSGDGGQAALASLNYPTGLFLDLAGNLYIADTVNNRVRKVDNATGTIMTIAGNGTYSSYVNGALAKATGLPYITGVALDAAGNLFIADDYSRIGKVHAATGILTTIAGVSASGFSGDGGPATSARLDSPHGIAMDSAGNIYIADRSNNRIRMVEVQAPETIPPTTTTSLPGGTYTGSQSTTLACDDGTGSGCAFTYFCLGSGCTPTTAYTGAITIASSTDLRFFSTDIEGNGETIKTVTYTINGSPGLSFTYGGNAPWFLQTAVSHDGIDAHQSGSISNSQSSWIETTLTGPGMVRFWWKVSSEYGYDVLSLSLDGANQTGVSISGESGWQYNTFVIPNGNHTVRWIYSTDGSVLAGSNAGWIDEVTFAPGDFTPPVTTATPAGGTYTSGQMVTLAANEPANIFYTIDGTDPVTSSTRQAYSGSISVSANTTIMYYAVDLSGNAEGVQTGVYTICTDASCSAPIAQGQLGGAGINSLGEVVWSQYDPATGYNQLYSSIRGQLTSDAVNHYAPAINNLGGMVWVEQSCYYDMYSNWVCSYTLKGIIGGAPVTLSSSQNGFGKIDLNDRGEVVWTQQDGTASQVYSNVRGKLTSGDCNRNEPSINNQGDVVFTSNDPMMPGPWQVYRLSAGSSTPVAVTNDVSEHRSPTISDSGEVVWVERNQSSGIGASVVSSTRGVLVPALTDIFGVDINNCGDIIYVTYENGQNRLYRLGSNAPCVTYPGANDTQTAASPVKFGDIYTGLMDGTTNPVDWYQFQATAGDSIYITVTFDSRPPNALNIGLYNADGSLLSGPNSPLGIHSTASMSGTYYLKVEAFGGHFGYTVSLSKYSNNCGVGPCPEVLAQGQLGGASVNSLGEVVWNQYDPATGYNQLYSSIRGQVTSDATNHYSPVVNNLGDLVWSEQSCGYDMYSNWVCGNSLKGLIGGIPVTIASNQNGFGKIDLNDRGEVVWTQQDGTASQVYSNVRGSLTSGDGNRNEPSINNQGDVVFLSNDPMMPGPWQVYRLRAGSIAPVAVTNDGNEHRSPAISDSGEVVWSERNPSSGIGTSVVSSTRGVMVPAVTDIFGVDVNNCGDIVYITYENGTNKLYRLGSNTPCMTIPERLYALAVSKDITGLGNGQVSSTPGGIDLATTLNSSTASFAANTVITLTATPDASSDFSGWSGACSGTGDCQVTMDMAKSITALFVLKPTDTTLPVTSATPDGGSFASAQTVSLACSDTGSGCAGTWYCLGTGCTPTTPYSSPLVISASTDLRFYSADKAGNNEDIRSVPFNIDLVKVEGPITTFLSTVQAACDTAGDSSIIKLRAALFEESIVISRPVILTLRGGFDDSYSLATGFTSLRGSLIINDGTVVIDGVAIL